MTQVILKTISLFELASEDHVKIFVSFDKAKFKGTIRETAEVYEALEEMAKHIRLEGIKVVVTEEKENEILENLVNELDLIVQTDVEHKFKRGQEIVFENEAQVIYTEIDSVVYVKSRKSFDYYLESKNINYAVSEEKLRTPTEEELEKFFD